MRTFVATYKDQYVQGLTLNPGTYTFQAYVKGSKFSIGFSLDDGETWENHNLDWQVIAADFQHVKYTFTLNNRITLFSLMNSVPATQTEIVAPFLEPGTNASTPRANEQDGMETTENLINEAIIKATFWVISASTPVIYKDSVNATTAGVHTPVTIQGELKRGTTSTVGGYLTITANGDPEATTALASPRTLSPGDTAGKTLYTIRLYDKATGGILLDTMTIPVVFKGATGIDAMNAVLSNEADVLPSSADGVTTDLANSGTSVRVFEGSRELSYNKTVTNPGTYKVDAVGTNATPANPTYAAGGYCNYGNILSISADKAIIVFTITGLTFENVAFTLTKTQSLSKSRVGATGDVGAPGAPGDPGVDGADGVDAELWKLSVVTEFAMIERIKTNDSPLTYSDKLNISLKYKVTHVKGNLIEYINAAAGAYHIKVRGNNGVPTSTEFSVGTTPNYSYTLNNYSTTTNKPTQLIVELYNNTTLVETRVVPIVLKADSWIEQDAQHIALINQSAESIASLTLANGALTQRIETLRNGVRNLISFGDVKTTFGSATGSSAQLWDSWTKLVTLKANTTYTLTACGCPSQGTVDAGGYMPVAVYGGTSNAFWKGVNFTSSTKEIKSITFSTSDSGFPADGVLTFNAYRSGGTGGGTQTCYLDWIVITEGSIPASDYFSDVETRLVNGQFIIDANTIIKQMLFATKALVGGAVFLDRFMYSKYGTGSSASNPETDYMLFDSSNPFNSTTWKANMVIDFLNGIFMASKGNVMFNQDGSGYLAGSNISWDANGNLDIVGKVHSSLYYGDTIYTSSIAGTPHQINLNVNPATTFIINTDNPYTILPSISSSEKVELTFIFDPTSGNGAKLQAYGNEYFRLYIGGNTKIFDNISGKGWIKVKAMSLTDGNFWVLIGVGGAFTTNVSGVNHTFTADSYV